MPSLNDQLRDRAIRHALQLAGYGRGLSDDVVRLLNRDDAQLIDRLASGLAGVEGRGVDLPPTDRKRLAALLADLQDINASTWKDVVDRLGDELRSLAAAEAAFQVGSLAKGLGDARLVLQPSSARLDAILAETPMDGHLFSAWTDQAEAGRIERVNQAIRVGMRNGASTDDIVRSIRGTRSAQYGDGVLNISRRGAQSLVRTAVAHVSNMAAQRTWRANDGIVSGWQFLATLDTRTTVTCAGLDGSTYPVGEGPIPPLHMRCRSISVAVTRSFRDLGVDGDEIPPSKRASMDGQVAAGTTFQTWLRGKDADVQDKVLGKTRAQLFRAGKLDLRQFIKDDGQVLTLEQLKKAHADILS